MIKRLNLAVDSHINEIENLSCGLYIRGEKE